MENVQNNVQDFIKKCQQSSQATHQAFQELVERLQSPPTFAGALSLWHQIAAFAEKESQPHFRISPFALTPETGNPIQFRLLELPSTFSPEAWSFTFYEGLTRYRAAEFMDRSVIELGTGTGWISIALAVQTQPAQMLGLDINPRAITCANLNLYLNGFQADGTPALKVGNRRLDEVVRFEVSDLLDFPKKKSMVADRIIGCIPQVLNPDPDFSEKILKIDGQASDEFLHALSNYTGRYSKQGGTVEEHFGLGLIARAIEESVDVLRPSGRIILNLGGRPGTGVLEHAFTRRGFRVQKVWRTQVSQAKDTDIQSLVEIEKRTRHRFEFFLTKGSPVSVSARTAEAFAQAGGQIFHELMVLEGRLRDPVYTPKIIRHLKKPGMEGAMNSLDLSFEDDALALEKLSFLASLSDRIPGQTTFPYSSTQGDENFRKRLAGFFRNYHGIPWTQDHFVIHPNRETFLQSTIKLFEPKLALVDAKLAGPMAFEFETTTLLEVPRRSDQAAEMISRLKPQLAWIVLTPEEALGTETIQLLISTAAATKTRIMIDLSEILDLSSSPQFASFYQWISKNPLPSHVCLVGGLVKNRIYHDLEVAFLITENASLVEWLKDAAELSFSRAPFLTQKYYEQILFDLLNFQLGEARKDISAPARTLSKVSDDGFCPIAPSIRKVFEHPAVVAEGIATAQTLRLDYGENSLNAHPWVESAVFEAFSAKSVSASDYDPRPQILKLLESRFQIRGTETSQVVLGNGLSSIFSQFCHELARRNGSEPQTLIFPSGVYGHFVATAGFWKVPVMMGALGSASRSYLWTQDDLKKSIEGVRGQGWLYLNAPLVNPTGALYSAHELVQLIESANQMGIRVVLDTVFSGLEFKSISAFGLGKVFLSDRNLFLGGLSKEWAIGGIRAGYAWTKDAALSQSLRSALNPPPHSTTQFVMKKIIEAAPSSTQTEILEKRARALENLLREKHWTALSSQGGLFMVAHPSAKVYESFSVKLGDEEKKAIGMGIPDPNLPTPLLKKIQDQGTELVLAIHKKTGVLVNPPAWTGIPNAFRFVLSGSEDVFKKAIIQLGG
ncbi:MAG: aminotransferase class I/II-fold pyridoxal phosphate-dependent enzyme [Bdellovibrionales bacterium]|nr:aminotransferase class I/II-fold pyridoxal phosphate-dependent enzyme [Bdellovibrionales bacterium]